MDLINGKIRPIFFKYLLAASGSSMIACVFGMVDAMMVGQYHGPVGNAALAVFNPLWSIFYCFGLLVGIGGSVLFANARGQGNEKTAQEYFTLSIIYGIILSAVSVVVIGLFHEPLFRLFGADDELLVLVKGYFWPVLFAIPFSLFINVLAAFLRNDGNPGLATKAVVIGGVFNAIGDYIFVFVLDMGISGAGLATAIGQTITALVMVLHFFGKKNTLQFVKLTKCLPKVKNISVAGFSTGINDLAMGVIAVLFNRQIMKYLGTDALAVYGILIQCTVLVQCLAYGTGQASQPILSQNYGAGKYDRIGICLKYSLYTGAVMGVVSTGVLLMFPNVFVYLFMTPTPAVLEIAPKILRIYSLSYLMLPFNIFATYYFQSVMRANTAAVLSVGRGVVVSGILILLLPTIAGADSIWYSMILTEALIMAYGIFSMVRCQKSY